MRSALTPTEPAHTRVRWLAAAVLVVLASCQSESTLFASTTVSGAHRDALARESIVDIEPAVRIGGKAPAFVVDGWLKGQALPELTKGTVYVVENWATWCKPCVEQMPHLSRLADKHAGAGLVIAAVNVEQDDLAGVRRFVHEHSSDMRYRVAYEHGGRMTQMWVKAAGLRGLPASFVIGRDSRIAWVGHPSALARVVDSVMARTWDLRDARDRARRERLAVRYSKRVVELVAGKEHQRGYQLAQALIATTLRDQPEYLAGLAYHILAAPGVVHRDLDVAYAAAEAACHVSEWKNDEWVELLATIGRAQLAGSAL